MGVEYEKYRAQYRTLGNAIMERSMLRLQTIHGDCMCSVTKIRRIDSGENWAKKKKRERCGQGDINTGRGRG